jgi:glycosyltransferase involved in cell wall biosynthesis
VRRPSRRPAGSRPRVGVDATPLGIRGKGVARYVRELLPVLAEAMDELDVVVLAPPEAELPRGAEHLERVDVRARPAVAWEQAGLPLAARRAGLSLVHTTTDRLPLVPSAPVVVYLFEDPRYRIEAAKAEAGAKERATNALTQALFPLSLRRAARVLVSSESTARDLAARGVDAARVRVVYPGVAERFRPARDAAELAAARDRIAHPDGYVLHFSSDDPRDNSDVVLRAYADAAADLPPLVIAGPVAGRLEHQQRLADELVVRDRVSWVGYRVDEDLELLYRGASAYVDPSRYEGFGFQVAEALASGTPVVSSRATSLPEVVGDAGVLLDPDDVAGFAAALVRVVRDGDDLRRRGPEQAARFRWEAAARETVAAWRELLP